MDSNAALRSHLTDLLTARQAHCTFADAVAHMPTERRGERPDALPYSAWELVEHIRRAQRDILDYCRTPDYEAGDWPHDYWPEAPVPSPLTAWDTSVAQVHEDQEALCDLIADETTDLYDTVPSSDEHTYLREVMLVADHTAYHVGQIVTVRRELGLWPPSGDAK
ncbi:DinB family protein [Salinibacter altiplanensis]|uniref:DinB family protein n=1 Tax=Salinibacter altiplanensis TaxID=1803181 RepID=UPI001F3B7CD2|nr:DinB family protein [Salinibacter altiplanensis]